MIVRNRESVLAEIQKLHDAARAGQNQCRSQLDRMRALAPGQCTQAAALRWRHVARAMKDQISPMSRQDEVAGREWDESPRVGKIRQIEDKDVGAATYFLSLELDYLWRLRAVVCFFSGLGLHPDDPDAARAYDIWELQRAQVQLADERAAAGDAKGSRTSKQCARATAALFDMICSSTGTAAA